MIFTEFFSAWMFLLVTSFALSLVLGATTQKTGFCTMGALSDWFNFNDQGRLKAWALAIAVAVLSVGIFEYYDLLAPENSFPNYRSPVFLYAENIIGGLLFGIGMTFASGCGNKTLVRIGEGDGNSFIVMIAMSLAVYYTINPLPNTDYTIFSYFFYDWIRPLSYELSHTQDISSFITAFFDDLSHDTTSLWVSIIVSSMLVTWVFSKKMKLENILSGLIVGLCVSSLWYVSNNIQINSQDELYSTSDFISEWDMVYEVPDDFPEDIDLANLAPQNPNTFKPQSFTFINPIGNTFGVAKAAVDNALDPEQQPIKTRLFLNIGVMAVFGVIIGSFLSNIIFGNWRPKFNSSPRIILKNTLAGITMGIGGTMAIGCTVGQGITGVSTLSIGSVLTLGCIALGSFATQKYIESRI